MNKRNLNFSSFDGFKRILLNYDIAYINILILIEDTLVGNLNAEI